MRLLRDESRGWFQACFCQETLRERRYVANRQVELDALNAVHGEENNIGVERLALANHDRKIFHGGEFGSSNAETFGSKKLNHPPEFFPRVTQSHND